LLSREEERENKGGMRGRVAGRLWKERSGWFRAWTNRQIAENKGDIPTRDRNKRERMLERGKLF
jgi:hypothetical protein